MPTCWNGDLGIDNNHRDHVAYTLNGEVDGPCPGTHTRRLPQVQFFLRINNYKGGIYELSNDSKVFHVDFMNGWEDGKLQEIIDNCPVVGDPEPGEYNPPCTCDQFLTDNPTIASEMCDDDVKALIINEEIAVINALPRGSCDGDIIDKSWTGNAPPLTCAPTPCVDCNNGDCDDDPDFFYEDDEDLGCEWVDEDPDAHCDLEWEGLPLSEYCPVACDACDEEPTSAPITFPTASPTKLPTASTCASWCTGNSQPWDTKCTWIKCGGCDECIEAPSPTEAPVQQGNCYTWCPNNGQSWSTKCNWNGCADCNECSDDISPTSAPVSAPCKGWCASNANPWSTKCNWANCSGCSACLA